MFFIAKQTRSAVRASESKNDAAMARRMTLIVMTDFCCWVPIILLGFASLGGARSSNDVWNNLHTYYFNYSNEKNKDNKYYNTNFEYSTIMTITNFNTITTTTQYFNDNHNLEKQIRTRNMNEMKNNNENEYDDDDEYLFDKLKLNKIAYTFFWRMFSFDVPFLNYNYVFL